MDYLEMAGELLRLRAEHIKSAVGRESERQSQGEYLALSCLFNRDVGTYPQTLSRELHVSSARIAAMLRDMEAKGWIERQTDPTDSRHILVFLTGCGRDEAIARRELILGSVAKMLERLGPEDAQALIRILKRMNEICI